MLFAESCCPRGFDIKVQDQQIWNDFSAYALQG